MARKVEQYKYFTVVVMPLVKNRITYDYELVTRHGDVIGRIEYYNHWRQHVLCPSKNTVWSAGCLADVAECLAKIKNAKVPS